MQFKHAFQFELLDLIWQVPSSAFLHFSDSLSPHCGPTSGGGCAIFCSVHCSTLTSAQSSGLLVRVGCWTACFKQLFSLKFRTHKSTECKIALTLDIKY